MERLYCDASYYRGIGGMAVVAPAWSGEWGGYWRSRWNVRITATQDWEDHIVFYASCLCRSSNDAEKRALGMAFLLAYDMIYQRGEAKVEIISDSLIVLDWIMNNKILHDPILDPLRSLWQRRTVILGKVKGHIGNRGNEIADQWAKQARRELTAKIEGSSTEHKTTKQEDNTNENSL